MNILFDLGNVVIDWDTEKVVRSLEISSEKKIIIKKELFDHSDWWKLDEGIFTEQRVAQRIVSRSILTAGEVEHCFQKAKESLTDIPETLELMEELRTAGVGMYCLSNMSVETYAFIKERPLFKYFSGIVISGFLKMTKPGRDIFEYTLNKFQLLPHDVVFVDDSEKNILAAEELGIMCVHFKRSHECYGKIRVMVKS